MKISNSKKQLARIISENGGWRDRAGFAAQGGNHGHVGFASVAPVRHGKIWDMTLGFAGKFLADEILPNWHQTILSRDEYFHLYPAPDADGWIEWKGGECPVDGGEIIDIRFHDSREEFGTKAKFRRWCHGGDKGDIIAYRLHKPEQSLGSSIGREKFASGKIDTGSLAGVTTIEQLTSDYRYRRDYADSKQQEADAARADAEAKLAELVAAGKALGLAVSVAEAEPELVITDWRDLRVGDVIELTAGERYLKTECTMMYIPGVGSRAKSADDTENQWWNLGGHQESEWRLIRRPSKGEANA